MVLHTVYEGPPVPGPVEVAGEREVGSVASGAHLEAVGSAGCHVTAVGGSRLSIEAEVAREGENEIGEAEEAGEAGEAGDYCCSYLLAVPACLKSGGKEWRGGPSTAVTPRAPADTWCSTTFTLLTSAPPDTTQHLPASSPCSNHRCVAGQSLGEDTRKRRWRFEQLILRETSCSPLSRLLSALSQRFIILLS